MLNKWQKIVLIELGVIACIIAGGSFYFLMEISTQPSYTPRPTFPVNTVIAWTADAAKAQTAIAELPTSVPTANAPIAPAPISPSFNEPSHPAGASAICNDGTYSYSERRRGTCSGHGGVRVWLRNLPP